MTLKRPYWIFVSLSLLLVLILLNLPSRTAVQLKLAIGGFFLPLFGLADSAHQLAERTGSALLPRSVLVSELERARQENQQLRLELFQQRDVWRENDQLRQMLGWQRQVPWQRKAARVVGRDPANWWRTIRIDVGSRDGVRTNLPVLNADGLVGRVLEVSLTHSQVVLVGDPNCRFSALVDRTRDLGIISPSSSVLDHSMVDLTFFSKNDQIAPGSLVFTSGQGGVFPRGIVVGKVVDTRTIGHGLYSEARVKLAVNLNRLEQVWVLMP